MTEEQLWWLSEFNLKPEILGENSLPKKLKIYDTTLRDGEQTIGVSFDKNEKLEIAKILDEIGVDRIEAGNLGVCRAVKGDIEACADVGIKHIIVEIATSHYKMKANNFTPEGVLERVVDSLQYAKDR
jgi:methanogen homocitrate synthase